MIDAVVQITQRVIGDGVIESFLPTLIDFETRTVIALEGIPSDVDQAAAVREWLTGRDLKTYAVAFRIDDAIHIAAISQTGNEFATMTRIDHTWHVAEAASVL